MITNIGYKSYIVFAIINFVTVPIVYFCYPEVRTRTPLSRTVADHMQTSRLPLEAVDLLFADRDGKRPSIFQVVRDSRSKAFMAEVHASLEERSRLPAEGSDAEKPTASGIENGLKA